MTPWMIFVTGSTLLTLVIVGGFLLFRRKNLLNLSVQNAAQDARFLVLSLWLASLSVLAYIAFTFGKR